MCYCIALAGLFFPNYTLVFDTHVLVSSCFECSLVSMAETKTFPECNDLLAHAVLVSLAASLYDTIFLRPVYMINTRYSVHKHPPRVCTLWKSNTFSSVGAGTIRNVPRIPEHCISYALKVSLANLSSQPFSFQHHPILVLPGCVWLPVNMVYVH